jgi:hypothetical protein
VLEIHFTCKRQGGGIWSSTKALQACTLQSFTTAKPNLHVIHGTRCKRKRFRAYYGNSIGFKVDSEALCGWRQCIATAGNDILFNSICRYVLGGQSVRFPHICGCTGFRRCKCKAEMVTMTMTMDCDTHTKCTYGRPFMSA